MSAMRPTGLGVGDEEGAGRLFELDRDGALVVEIDGAVDDLDDGGFAGRRHAQGQNRHFGFVGAVREVGVVAVTRREDLVQGSVRCHDGTVGKRGAGSDKRRGGDGHEGDEESGEARRFHGAHLTT
ncbi:MAG: hypothetical protein IPF66_13740 [Holophagales bacterium]|nr:hypothetical protein [Holophagales bacterium]